MQSEKICYLLRWPHHWHIILHISNHPHRVPGAVHQQPGSTVEVTGHLHADTLLLWASSWFPPDDIIMFLLPAESKSTCEWCCELCSLQQLLLLFLMRICQCQESCFGYLLAFCFIPCVCYHALKCSFGRFTNFIGQLVSVQGMILQYIVPYMTTHQFLLHTE